MPDPLVSLDAGGKAAVISYDVSEPTSDVIARAFTGHRRGGRAATVMTVMTVMAVWLFVATWTASAWGRSDSTQARLRLISVRDHIDGGMTTPQAVYADATRIYLATSTGKLYVLARDVKRDFPVKEVVTDTDAQLTAVRGDRRRLYVAAADGLRVYDKGAHLTRVAFVPGTFSSVGVRGQRVYLGLYQTHMAVTRHRLYFSGLNFGDGVLELDARTLTTLRSFAWQPELGAVTTVLDRTTGAVVGTLPNPLDFRGNPGLTSIYADSALVGLGAGSCCGFEARLFDASSDQPLQTILTNTNTMLRSGGLLVIGGEEGAVKVFDLRTSPSPGVASANLPALTGHTQPEDIEIRSLYADRHDKLVFAGSSWGNDRTRGPDLPPFFVLELKP